MSNYFVIGNSESRNMIFGVDGVAGSIQSISSGATSAYAHLTFNQNGGNVGIGSATPYSLFTIKSSYSGGTTGGFCLDANDGTAYRLFLYPYVQGSGQVAYQFNTQNAGTTYTSLVLGYNGNVGIGTTNPGGQIHLYSATTDRSNCLRITSKQPGIFYGWHFEWWWWKFMEYLAGNVFW